jgi:peptide/nickel transport system substrate-binding protein
MNKKHAKAAFLVGFFLVFCSLISGPSFAGSESPKYGGTFKVAMDAEIPTLDCMISSTDAPFHIGGHIFETLIQYLTADGKLAPELADSWEVSNDNLKFTFKLRKGVRFHNGSELTSEDVLASVERWLKYGGRGGIVRPYFDRLSTPDKYTFEIYLKEPYAPLLSLLGYGNGGPVIIPASIARASGSKVMSPENYIGTGPYKFGKWIQGEYIRLDRWDGYVPRDEPPNGRAGKKIAYLDHLEFHIVTEVAARVNGIGSGQYHYALNLPNDLYVSLVKDPKIRVVKLEPTYWCQIFFNTKEGLCANQGLRQAILATLDMGQILAAAFGDLSVVQGSIFPKSTPWYTTAGLDKYNQKNPKLGLDLAQKAGYKGEKIRMLVGSQWPAYEMSQVVAKQLKDAGFNIDFQKYDWAGVVANRRQPDKWEFFVTYGSAVYYDPGISYWLSPTYPGWWDTPEKLACLKDFVSTTDYKARLKAWSRFQEVFYTQVPIIKLGDYYTLHMAATEDHFKGFGTKTHPVQTFTYAWNMWLP